MTEPGIAEVSPPPGEAKIRLGKNYWKLWSASVVSNLGDGVALIAYPWLASAVTRDPFLIALIAVAQRLPWLVFSLPAGVITDRLDRKKIMMWSSVFRTGLTGVVAVVVLMASDTLPSPTAIGDGPVSTNLTVYLTLVFAALLFGVAEVLFDNSAQTILPAIVEPEGLETANGRLWGAEMVMNSFAGPPLGSLMIAAGFAVPFFFDMGTFAVSAALIFTVAGVFTANGASDPVLKSERKGFWAEIKEGMAWLWGHPLLRPLAIILGLLNGLGSLTIATFILFAQEVLGVTAFTFALIGMAGAVGGAIGAVAAPRFTKRFGSGTSLYVTLLGTIATSLAVGLSSNWVFAGVMMAGMALTGSLWNVITVSLRQTIIPDHLLGRVNSVYRFFGWGMMPIGLALGGLIVRVSESAGVDRVMALRLPWFIAGAAILVLFVWAAPKLTTEKIDSARSEGIAAKQGTADRGQGTGDRGQGTGDRGQ
ncbi:MAG: MFS transporter, partial [Actinomycetota bacterium]|nr:MFS transporter [Actinomycetota bacterium]